MAIRKGTRIHPRSCCADVRQDTFQHVEAITEAEKRPIVDVVDELVREALAAPASQKS
jgi:hypothetical protein